MSQAQRSRRTHHLVHLCGVLFLTGVVAGLGGAAVVYLLHLVQHLAFGYSSGSFARGSARASALRRVLALAFSGLAAGLGFWLLRRGPEGQRARPVTLAKAMAGEPMPVSRSTLNALLQVVVVGAGASIGREGAPREIGATAGGWLADRAGLTQAQRRLVLACGAGAGLAAVYNVPVSGALFALEILLATAAPRAIAAAALVSGVATGVADLILGAHETYSPPATKLGVALLLTSLVLGPVAAPVGLVFSRLGAAATANRPTGWRLIPACLVILTALGGVAVAYPQVLGNGKAPTALVLAGGLSLPTIAALLVLKPLVTAACLRADAVGGLLTPAIATGALLGGLTGGLIHQFAPSTPVASVAIVGAAAVLSVTQRAPLTAIALLVEFTGGGAALVVPLVIGVAGAQLTARALTRPGRLET